MARSRRSLIGRGVMLGAVSLAGCLSGDGNTSSPTTENEMPTEIRFWLRQVSLSQTDKESIDPIIYTKLPDGEQEIVKTALKEEEYTSTIGEESRALENLRQRISERTEGGVKAYFRREDTYYRIGFVSGDNIITNPSF